MACEACRRTLLPQFNASAYLFLGEVSDSLVGDAGGGWAASSCGDGVGESGGSREDRVGEAGGLIAAFASSQV